jgi:hypothetical protein
MVRYCFNADPDLNPDFYLNADPDPGSQTYAYHAYQHIIADPDADSILARLDSHAKLNFYMKNILKEGIRSKNIPTKVLDPF